MGHQAVGSLRLAHKRAWGGGPEGPRRAGRAGDGGSAVGSGLCNSRLASACLPAWMCCGGGSPGGWAPAVGGTCGPGGVGRRARGARTGRGRQVTGRLGRWWWRAWAGRCAIWAGERAAREAGGGPGHEEARAPVGCTGSAAADRVPPCRARRCRAEMVLGWCVSRSCAPSVVRPWPIRRPSCSADAGPGASAPRPRRRTRRRRSPARPPCPAGRPRTRPPRDRAAGR